MVTGDYFLTFYCRFILHFKHSINFDIFNRSIFLFWTSSYSVIGIGRSPDTNVKKINLKHALDLDRRGLLHRQYNLPPSKDTIAVPNNGYVVLRFRADNPGTWYFWFEWFDRFLKATIAFHCLMHHKKNLFFFAGSWLFHCHFLYHIVIGMNLILQVGTQTDLPPIPPGFPTCGDHTPPIPIN